MTLVVMQPTYLPWLGYFDLMRRADTFVVYDSAQFSRQSWQQRNRIRGHEGELMLTVPVLTKGRFGQSIGEVEVNPAQDFAHKHLGTIHDSYRKTRNFGALFPRLEALYAKGHRRLLELNMDLIQLAREQLGIATPLVFSSSLDVKGKAVEALVDMCEKLGAGQYLSPPGAKVYIDENNLFEKKGIGLAYHEYSHPVYAQAAYPDFLSHLGFIDFLFNRAEGQGF